MAAHARAPRARVHLRGPHGTIMRAAPLIACGLIDVVEFVEDAWFIRPWGAHMWTCMRKSGSDGLRIGALLLQFCRRSFCYFFLCVCVCVCARA